VEDDLQDLQAQLDQARRNLATSDKLQSQKDLSKMKCPKCKTQGFANMTYQTLATGSVIFKCHVCLATWEEEIDA